MARSRRPSRAVLALATCTILPALAAQQPDAIPVAKGVARAALADLPVRIEPNLGQWHSPELYRLRAGGLDVFLERDGWSFWLREPDPVAGGRRPSRAGGPDTVRGRRAVALRMGFVGGGAARVSPERPLPGVTNHLVGDQKGHRANVPGYAAVLYEEMYPGVDLRVREGGGHMEYDLLLAPGAALDQVRVQVTGAQALRIDSNGALVLETALGDVVQPAPATWMAAATADGQREPVACEFVLLGRDTFGFAAPDRDPTRALVVDPPLQYASYVGGSGYDEPWHVTVAADGDILCCGYTESANFPVTPGAVQTTYGTNADGWIVRIDPGQPGQFEFATYVGGVNWDTVYAVHELASGVLAFAGGTQSPSLPVTANAYQSQLSGPTDAIVGLLDAGGTTLNALTYFGGSGTEWARGVAFDLALQQLVIAGSTFSVDLPTQNAYQPNNAGGTNFRDGFVTTFDLAPGDLSTIGMSTYLGGSGDDWLAIASGETLGIVTVYGGTESADFPTSATAFQPTFTGGGANWWSQAIGIAQLDLLNNGLAYGTYVDAGGDEVVGEVHASLGGRDLFVVGTTTSINLPTTPGAYQSSFQGGSNNQGFVAGDAFAMRIDTTMAGAAGPAAISGC
ncbi:MAG: hypothetical protein NXI31_26210, partial [bacterium]|nr:hypothetical protein [bacterium]